jgi:hypothetical protein
MVPAWAGWWQGRKDNNLSQGAEHVPSCPDTCAYGKVSKLPLGSKQFHQQQAAPHQDGTTTRQDMATSTVGRHAHMQQLVSTHLCSVWPPSPTRRPVPHEVIHQQQVAACCQGP